MKKLGLALILILFMGILPVNALVLDSVEPKPLLQVYDKGDYYQAGNTEFYKDSQGYDRLLKPDESVFVYSQRYRVERLEGKNWKTVGIPTSVTASDTEITRHYTDYLGATFDVIYHIDLGKTDVLIDSSISAQYRIVWELDGITNTEYQVNPRGINFTSSVDWVYADWSMAQAESFFSVSDTANGKKLDVIFDVGVIGAGESYLLDPTLMDSYTTANQDTGYSMKDLHPSNSADKSSVGQSFTSTGRWNITSVKFYLQETLTATGDGYAHLYTHSGVYGASSKPTGAPLAVSEAVAVSGIGAGLSLIEFTFNASNQYQLDPTQTYCIAYINPTAGDITGTDYITAGIDQSAPTHGGNIFYYANSAWSFTAGYDMIFYLYVDSTPINEACDSSTTIGSTAGWVNVTVGDVDGVANLKTVDIQVNTTGDAENFTLRWTQAGDSFSELSDPDDIANLQAGSVRTNINATHDLISFYFNMTDGTSGLCDVNVTTEDDNGNIATIYNLHLDEFTYTYYNWDPVGDLINSAFSFFNITGAMTSMIAYVNGVSDEFSDSITNMVAVIVQQFRIIPSLFGFVIAWFTRIVSMLLTMWGHIMNLMQGIGTVTTGLGNVWDFIEIGTFLDFITLVLVLMWWTSIEKRGATQGEIQVFINDAFTAVNILSYFMTMFGTVINIVVDYAFRLLEAIV